MNRPRQVRWIVDAMNVIGSRPNKWWHDPDRAMREFAEIVDAHAASTGRDITVVFDKDPGEFPRTAHVNVIIARRRGRNAADYEIRRLVEEEGEPAALRVVTSDRRLAESVGAAGAVVVAAGSFREQLWGTSRGSR